MDLSSEDQKNMIMTAKIMVGLEKVFGTDSVEELKVMEKDLDLDYNSKLGNIYIVDHIFKEVLIHKMESNEGNEGLLAYLISKGANLDEIDSYLFDAIINDKDVLASFFKNLGAKPCWSRFEKEYLKRGICNDLLHVAEIYRVHFPKEHAPDSLIIHVEDAIMKNRNLIDLIH